MPMMSGLAPFSTRALTIGKEPFLAAHKTDVELFFSKMINDNLQNLVKCCILFTLS